MRKLFSILIVGTLFLIPVLGHGEEKTGILVDAGCGAKLAKEQSGADTHPVSCALENAKGGLGILVDGKFIRFDDQGNRQAQLLLKATEKTSNVEVRVEGHFDGDSVEVSGIETVD